METAEAEAEHKIRFMYANVSRSFLKKCFTQDAKVSATRRRPTRRTLSKYRLEPAGPRYSFGTFIFLLRVAPGQPSK